MNSALTVVSIEGILMTIVNVVVVYMAVLSYRLPYGQVVLTYAGLTLIGAILAKLINPTIQIGEQRRPLDARTVSRQAMSLLGVGLLDLVAGIAGFIAVIMIASYRFSFLEILGMIAAGSATGIVVNGVLGVL
jgi:hypothetical protein